MAISDSEYTAWLSSPSAMRCVLVEATVNSGGSEVTRYMSNKGYVTGASDSPSNTTYTPIIIGGVKLSETLSLDSNPTLSFGDIEIDNTNGVRDSWLFDVWENRSVTVFYGDMRWARSDFRQVFKGTAGGIDSRQRNTLNISLRDDLQKLNVNVSTTTYGTGQPSVGKLVPLCFGECFNVSPVIVDKIKHIYAIHNRTIPTAMVEIRDNGVPIGYLTSSPIAGYVAAQRALGQFELLASPFGTVTASVFGDSNTTNYDCVSIITTLLNEYGTTVSQSVPKDTTNFSNFQAANNYPMGIYLTEKSNLLDVCQRLVGSVGGQITVSRNGYIQILRINLPATSPTEYITKRHIVEDSLEIDSKLPIKAAVKVAFAKNDTVQSNLPTAINEEARRYYEEEYTTVIAKDTTVANKYKLTTEADPVETLLIVENDAVTEANRRLNILKEQRMVYRMTCYASMLELSLGQVVNITHNRFGMSGGKNGVVVGLEPDWLNGRVGVKVMV